MPNITITEQNLTSSITTIGTDIPYIPGFVGEDYVESTKVDISNPILFTSVADFERDIGSKPYVFTTEEKDTNNVVIVSKGDVDRSYIMASELLKLGMPVYYHAFNVGDPTQAILGFYRDLSAYLQTDDLKDASEYTIKYITSGGYPNVNSPVGTVNNLYTDLKTMAENRGDCVAIAEYANKEGADLTTSGFKAFMEATIATYASEYATAFYPWAKHTVSKKYDNNSVVYTMPACYSYLISLAKSIKTNPNWLAIAGVGRGYVPSIDKLNLTDRLSNKIADTYQPTEGNNVLAINAITNIKPYGFSIWGNRTLKKIEAGKKLDATNFLNTRNMISDIKKVCYSAAKALMFEQNSDLLWLDFKGRITPYLERLSAGRGISGYSIIKLASDKREQLKCQLRIYPISAVESFDIAIQITDSDVSVQ